MSNVLQTRWTENSEFIEIIEEVILKPGRPQGEIIKDWYQKKLAPVADYYLPGFNRKNLDCRNLHLCNRTFGDRELGHIFNDAVLRNNLFIETGFQDGTAKDADFSGSRFVRAQMSPFFAKGANFEGCTFIKSFLYGAYASYRNDPDGEEMYNGIPTDLTECNFTRVVADDTDFGVCDFKGADFTEAYFEKCVFQNADLRSVNFTGTRFVKCSFEHAWLFDTPENRALLERGDNLKTDTVVWKQAK